MFRFFGLYPFFMGVHGSFTRALRCDVCFLFDSLMLQKVVIGVHKSLSGG